MRPIWKWLKNESGQSIILIAISMVVLCGFAALAVDIARVSAADGQLQNAADAAALGGAWSLPSATTAKSQAIHYAGLNGISAANTTVTTPYSGNSSKIEVVCKATVDYTFARIFGMTSKTISARAVAEKAGMSGGAFGYAIFYGSNGTYETLQLGMQTLNVTGSIHSNANIMMNGTNATISGDVEAVRGATSGFQFINVNGTFQGSPPVFNTNPSNVHVAKVVNAPATYLDMPPFWSIVKSDAAASNTLYTTSYKTINDAIININHPIYVDGGDLNISGGKITGQGCIVATGNITISGNLIKLDNSASVCIYSINGNITMSGSDMKIDGVLYAPNGLVQINGTCTVNGRVIGKYTQLNANSITVNAGSNDLACLPGGSVKLVE